MSPTDFNSFNVKDEYNTHEVGQEALLSGYLTELELKIALESYSKLNYVNLAYYNASAIDKKFHLPEDIARKHNCCVIAIDSDNYVVAMADPCNNEINESLSEILDAHIQPVLVDLFQLERHINTVYKHEVYAKSLLKKFRQELHTDDSKNEDLDFLRSSDQASAVVLLEEILSEAYHQKASDVHIEYEKHLKSSLSSRRHFKNTI